MPMRQDSASSRAALSQPACGHRDLREPGGATTGDTHALPPTAAIRKEIALDRPATMTTRRLWWDFERRSGLRVDESIQSPGALWVFPSATGVCAARGANGVNLA